MLQNRPVIPASLRPVMLQHLHAAHGGAQAMLQRDMRDLYWPGYKQDILDFRAACATCNLHAPSNPAEYPTPEPSLNFYPFQVICADFFHYKGKNYLALVDKYSNWLSVLMLQKDTASNLIKALKEYFSIFAVAEQICTDGATIFTATELQDFFKNWSVLHRISSAYHLSSNKRAELAVKSAKRLVRENLAINGSLNTDAFIRALLIHRNTPDSSSKVSPAEIVFGHNVRDQIPGRQYAPRRDWAVMAAKREESFLKRHFFKAEKLESSSRKLPDLQQQDSVYVKDQSGPSPKAWSKSGKVVECLPHNSYLIRIDGSGHLTRRNRKFLRKFVPYTDILMEPTSPQVPQPYEIGYIGDSVDTPLAVLVGTFEMGHETRDAGPNDQFVSI